MKADLVGGKMAHLAELANTLGLPTPDGMVVTTEGFRLLLEEGGIRSWIQDKHLEIVSEEDVDPVSKELQDRILSLPIPPALEEEILRAYDRLAERAGARISVAVRSSAVGEDSEFSFAGQFLSVLNVPREELCEAYLQVIASLFSPEAMHYRFLHKIPGESAQMAVGIHCHGGCCSQWSCFFQRSQSAELQPGPDTSGKRPGRHARRWKDFTGNRAGIERPQAAGYHPHSFVSRRAAWFLLPVPG